MFSLTRSLINLAQIELKMINNRTNDLSMRLDIIKILKKSHWNEKKTLNESKVLCELNKYKNKTILNFLNFFALVENNNF